MKDLICLVADKNMEAAVQGLLTRNAALGIRPLDAEIKVHPRRDPGVFGEGIDFLRSLHNKYRHGLLVLDAAWEGAPQDVQSEIDQALDNAGLAGWAQAIVIVPELEAWVWSDSPHVDEALGWAGRDPALKEWLQQKGLWAATDPKPKHPKAAVESALYEVRKPRSSAIYRTLAQTVSVERCQDSAFLRFRETLQVWFPATP
ncbi:MAG: hypothetical protein KatS3mg052_2530 [Candidatus Roseilinea sp.]|nr:MAG: hypothetical protein KatS3mg052_2530 [Candidatus Roseilinea sp.]